MSRQEEQVSKFVRRAVLPSSGYTRLQLVHQTTTGSSVLRNFDLKSEFGYSEEETNNLTAEILGLAQEDADGHMGLSKYCIRAIKGVSFVERSPLFRLRSQNEEDDMGESEGATTAGIVSQLMRHNEAIMRTSMMKDEIHSRAMTDIIARLTAREQHYEDRHWENILRTEELLSEKESRELARLEAISKSKRLDEAIKAFKPLVPALASKLKGIGTEAKGTLQTETLMAIMQDLKPDEMEKIANILGTRSLALVELYVEANKEKLQSEQEAPAEEAKH